MNWQSWDCVLVFLSLHYTNRHELECDGGRRAVVSTGNAPKTILPLSNVISGQHKGALKGQSI